MSRDRAVASPKIRGPRPVRGPWPAFSLAWLLNWQGIGAAVEADRGYEVRLGETVIIARDPFL